MASSVSPLGQGDTEVTKRDEVPAIKAPTAYGQQTGVLVNEQIRLLEWAACCEGRKLGDMVENNVGEHLGCDVFVHVGCQNNSARGWVAYKQQDVFLTVAEAGGLRPGWQHGWGLVRALFRLPRAEGRLLGVSLTWWEG